MEEVATYDLFISYAAADRAWVEGYLLNAMTEAGIRCHSEATFALGAVRLVEFEHAIEQSRRTLLVLSPAYLADDFSQFVGSLAQCYGFETATWPVIPLVLHPVDLPPSLNVLVRLDATNPEEWGRGLERLCADLQRPVPLPLPRPECPYPGMTPFSEADSRRFFGRDREVGEMLNDLRLHSFLTVIGPSGSGKSSVVFAGLMPALRQTGLFGSGTWLIHSMRPGNEPLSTLETMLGGDLAKPNTAVAKTISAQTGVRRLLLVVDQFEEVFTLAEAEAAPFQEALLRLIEVPDCYLILTVRADFYPEMMSSLVWPQVRSHRFEILPLDDPGLRQAILRPAEDVGVFVEASLVERLITDAAGEPGVLPLIQETLVLLWERVERRFLSLNAYETFVLSRKAYGAVGGGKLTGLQIAMARRADAALADLDERRQAIARRIFLRLVQFGEGRADTRRQQPIEALRTADEDLHLFERTLSHLAERRLLTLSGEESSSGRKADIAHEALIGGWPTLQQWVRERREAEQTRRRLEAKADEWVRLGGGSALLDEVESAEAERWLSGPDAAELGYNNLLPALVSASQEAIQQAKQREEQARQRELQLTREALEQERKAKAQEEKARQVAQTRNRLAAVFLVLISALAIYAFIQQRLAQKSSQEARQQSILSLSKASEAFLASHQQIEALVMALKTGRRLTESSWGTADVPIQAIIALQQAVYSIKERSRLEGHSDWVTSVSFSRDGRIIATASKNTIRLWTREGALLNTFEDHQEDIQEISFSPDGRTLASAGLYKPIKLWSLDGKVIRTLRDPNDDVEWFSSVSISPSGEVIAAACGNNSVKLWRLADGQLLRTLAGDTGHKGTVVEAGFNPNGELLASASEDGTVRLWRVADGHLLRIFRGGGSAMLGVSFSPDGELVASADADHTVKLWRLDGTLVRTLKGHLDAVLNVQFSPDGKVIASAGKDGTVKLWNLDGGPPQELRGHQDAVRVVRFSPDGKTLASGSHDKTVRLWSLDGIAETSLTHAGGVHCIKLSPDGQMLASASDDGTIKLWRRDGALLHTLDGHQGSVLSVSFSADGEMIASAGADQTVRLWGLDGRLRKTLTEHRGSVSSVCFSPDGALIASASADRTVRLWGADGRLRRTLEGHQDQVNSVCFSPDGELIASASSDKTVKIWDTNGKEQQTLDGHGKSVLGVNFSPKGDMIAFAGEDATVRLWRRNGEKFESFGHPLQGHSGSVYSISFYPGGKILASAGYDGTIKFWSLDGVLLQTIREHQNYVFDLCFSPDGRMMASASIDGKVKLWNLDLGDLMARGCEWVKSYLKTSHNLSEGDRHVCDGIGR